jgi:phage shock protein PspC (stress-responsive transcriptional regulator)
VEDTQQPEDQPTARSQKPRGWLRSLRRSADDRYVAGIAGGVAEALDVDPLYVRIALVVLAVFAPLTIVAYVIVWLLLPTEGSDRSLIRSHRDPGARGAIAAALALGVGAAILAPDLGLRGRPGVQLGVVLTLVGIALLMRNNRDAEGGRNDGPAAPSEPAADMTVATSGEPPPRWLRSWRGDSSARGRVARAPRPRPFLGPLALSVLVLVVGVAIALDHRGHDVRPGAVVSIGLLVLGAALVTSAWWGRARGLMPIALLLMPLWVAWSLTDVARYPGVGDHSYRPTTRDALAPTYAVGLGNLRVDLTEFPMDRGSAIVIDIGVTAGVAHVYVPADEALWVTGRVGLGGIEVTTEPTGNIDADAPLANYDLDRRYPAVSGGCWRYEYPCTPPTPVVNPARVTLRVDVGLGSLEVHRVPTSD